MKNKWIVVDEWKPEAKYRLICFPYAGAGASVYNKWNEKLPSDIELIKIELPGRGSRLTEMPIRHLNFMVRQLHKELLTYLTEKPFIFFGYSMGALLCYELTKLLLIENGLKPEQLFVSAHRAPHINRDDKPVSQLTDEELVQRLKQLNGTPEIVLQTPELLQLVLQIMRADLELCDSYVYNQATLPLDIPITAFAGHMDKTVSVESVEAWSQHTKNHFTFKVYEGDHFFIRNHEESLIEAVINSITSSKLVKLA